MIDIDIIERLQASGPKDEDLAQDYHDALEQLKLLLSKPEATFFQSIIKLTNKLSKEIDDLADSGNQLLTNKGTDELFDRSNKLLIQADKVFDSIQRGREAMGLVDVEEKKPAKSKRGGGAIGGGL